ncbi:MAG: ATP phosphoribosyltransferase regulatory subunit [Gallionellales bacterium 35-53-114]|jgi:ATP phosphoribosyltransferase regulatory subunit|nr:MAG: ATP phosphoribosyltransferase regulatory subunit [Gallionellales bacterium 35-53-114]OYZ64681.1 MAG: ATP phosphoribosyltransferase regulatory subunit [Gallionellales bacterium 24-53-125]OZB07780.1 MAG: ATP phosphoribosyltransferase regulatory subunit [Gallionellales bacterium 39-52-133]HQS58506.1 ATP phosphoribosyltransferase regulatory subunit [Gallionellaceae bacterium]HQS74847.1 ATP phosphoribosyltransferase regulatory subunit [Gallionellaceae bacterium]
MPNWLLPEYIQDMLPEEAWRIEAMRSKVIELLRLSGYQLVVPPLLEYEESLLISDSQDMDVRTFKLVDQLSGRTMALRADITPQVARIDAHLLNCQGVTRLCYAGSVLHTQPSGLMRTREPLQIGAELYGHSGLESDLEVQRLMLQALALTGVDGVHLDLGHVGVFRALVQRASIGAELEAALFAALQLKDVPALQGLVAGLPADVQASLLALAQLYGGAEEVLQRAHKILPDFTEIRAALNELEQAAAHLKPLAQGIGVDLAELRGYHYHSGMVFAAYHAGSHDAIALGGRYDDLGKSFGRARPATGFSMDLRQLFGLLPPVVQTRGILAPYSNDAALLASIARLRSEGHAVVVDLLGNAAFRSELNCDRELILRNSAWVVVELDN